MRSAEIAPDASGTLVASSFLYASARDLARLGLLFLQDGVFAGQRLLPEEWVAYTLTPAKDAPDGNYGAHMWLKLPESEGYGEPPMPDDAMLITSLVITSKSSPWCPRAISSSCGSV